MSITIYESEQQEKFLTFWEPITQTVLDSVGKLTSDAYRHSIAEFLLWWADQQERNPIVAVTAYKAYLSESGLKPATVNKKLSAVRRLFETAAVYGIGKTGWPFTFEVATAIKSIKNVSQHGRIHGTRLSQEQLEKLCYAPDPDTLLGKRDRAILAILVGSGLRRSELANLTWGHIKRAGKIWVISDLVGKHGMIRETLLPQWAYDLLKEYSDRGANDERVIVSYDRHGNPRRAITPQSIYKIVEKYSQQLDLNVKPHDLRRSNARFLREQGAPIEDIQKSLGHSAPNITSGYIGDIGHLDNLEDLWEGFGEKSDEEEN